MGERQGSTGGAGARARLAKASVRYRFAVLTAGLLLTLYLGERLLHLGMPRDPLGTMYPDGHPFLPALEAIAGMAPEPRILVVLLEVEGGDIYNPATIAKIDRITKALMGMDGILPDGVTSLTRKFDHYENSAEGMSIEPILGRRWPETAEEFQTLRHRVAINPMGPGRYVSYDGTVAMITAPLDDIEKRAEKTYADLSDRERSRKSFEKYKAEQSDAFDAALLERIEELERAENDGRHRLYFMGPQVIRAQMTRMGMWQVPCAAAAMFLLVAALLGLRFRTVHGVLVPLVAMVVSLVWALGVFAVAGREFNPMSLPFPVLLSVFTLCYAAAVLDCYRRRDDTDADRAEAVAAACSARPIGTSVLTAGLVPMTLCLAAVPMLRDVGWLAAFWSAGTILVLLCLTPALISLFPPPSAQRYRLEGAFRQRPSGAGHRWGGRLRYRAAVLVLLTSAAGAVCVTRLEVGDNVPGSSYLRPGHPWKRCFDLFSEKFMGPYQLLVFVKAKRPGGLIDPGALTAMADFSTYLRDVCGARDSIGLDMMIQMARMTLTDGNPKWQTIPSSAAEIERLAGLVVEQGGLEEFVDKTFTQATISPFFPASDEKSIDSYANKMQRYIEQSPSDTVDFRLGGGLLGMTKALNDGTRGSYGRLLALAYAATLGLSLLATRSVRAAVAVTLPLVVVQGLLWALMAAVRMPVSMAVIPGSVASVGFGSLFGYCLAQGGPGASRGAGPCRARDSAVCKETESLVCFLGVMVAAACLPWTLLGLAFQATMVLSAALAVVVQSFVAVLFVPLVLERQATAAGRAS